jgi:hypothetical protein
MKTEEESTGASEVGSTLRDKEEISTAIVRPAHYVIRQILFWISGLSFIILLGGSQDCIIIDEMLGLVSGISFLVVGLVCGVSFGGLWLYDDFFPPEKGTGSPDER